MASPSAGTKQHNVLCRRKDSFSRSGMMGGGLNLVDDGSDSLSSKLNKLSFEERACALDDLHGVSDMEDETPSMLLSKLQEMTDFLSSFPANKRTRPSGQGANTYEEDNIFVYRQALEMSPEYVERMKVVCLRVECYDSRNATTRLVRFFNHKKELFGADKLAQKIGLEDLDEQSLEALEKGLFQLLERKDRSGRAVFVMDGGLMASYSIQTILRVLYYITMVGLQEEENQKRGFVLIYSAFGQESAVNGRGMVLINRYFARPARMVAIHLCMPECSSYVFDYVVAPMVYKFFDSHSLGRLRFHMGTPLECSYLLLSFGITKEALPFDLDGRIKVTNHHRSLEGIEEQEGKEVVAEEIRSSSPGFADSSMRHSSTSCSPAPPNVTSVPGHMDIVTGRGRRPKTAPGPMTLWSLLQEHSEAYENAPRLAKQTIAGVVLDRLKESGCRILKQSGSGYVEYNTEEAKVKICHDFRNMKMRRGRAGGAKG